jgi:hypothetical protein
MTGKLSRSPFNEGDEQHIMAKLSQCQRYTRYHHQKVERLYILGVLKQQYASK